ncbi:FecR family protein [Maribellus maritimus]|uniref:FecR family protein n=1 Tax=Maribellus maritimus TaxID=2870838 RepID=UPI001EECD964|nr:FecR domain-containing protein [Maribellus maritimus]MCG6191335.1 FecR domain-containing protein [Maribellus maritimus]
MNKIDSNRIWELAVKKIYNSLNTEEEVEFEKIENSNETQKILRQVKQIYAKSSNSFYIQAIDKEKNWRYINNQIKHNSLLRRILIHSVKYAAIFFIALFIGVMVPRLLIFRSQEIAHNKIEMEWGQMGKMTLSDGTKVWLNAGTILEYPTNFDTRKRSVSLSGEAQFKVTPNDKIPFEVKTNTGIIKVYGTTFNVAAYKDDPEMIVTLVEGKVSVENSNGDNLATLKPSEQLGINKHTGKVTLRKVDTHFYSSWIEGKILLDETKLSDLVKILERWYNVDIKLLDEKIGNIQISGTISKNKPLDLFLKILERMYGIKYKLIINNNKKDEILIFKN